ncbi:MAG: TetR/AcrR family transcriptional regulator [Acidimicrobiales bacterium]
MSRDRSTIAAGTQAGATTERLPRGRHHLSRAQVEQSQRRRLLAAMAEALTEKGYVGTSVADVLEGAGVSRQTFYQQFSSKLDCFMHAFDAAGDLLFARLDEAQRQAHGPPIERFERALGAYFDSLDDQPALARVFLVEVYAAGPRALERRAALQGRIVRAMSDLLGARSDQARFACEVLVAGVGALVTGPLVTHDRDALRGLEDRVIDLVRLAVEARPVEP